MNKGKPTNYCSFCGKSEYEVVKLIAGPSVMICDECTDKCQQIVAEERNNHTANVTIWFGGQTFTLHKTRFSEATWDIMCYLDPLRGGLGYSIGSDGRIMMGDYQIGYIKQPEKEDA